MRFNLLLLSLFVSLNVNALTNEERLTALRALDWHIGPQTENVISRATLKTPPGGMFVDEANSKKFLELTGNIPEAGNNIFYAPEGWWAAFSFNPIGHVKDDEKIDADALMKSMKESDGPANEERKKLGIPALYTDGWFIPPHYDMASKRLEWGVRLRTSEGKESLNYTVRLLGRSGVMSATLVSSPSRLNSDVESFKSTLTSFDFNSGERYAEFKQGDRVAEYGLAALIAGGAAAVATKKGLWTVIGGFFAAFWKIIAGVGIALAAWLRSKFKAKT